MQVQKYKPDSTQLVKVGKLISLYQGEFNGIL